MCPLQDKANGKPQIGTGSLRATAIATGVQIKFIVDQQAVVYHLLNGAFLFGSSRTQRVVSLSSCESELHAMISTLSDGIFLRRCLEFIFNVQVEHVMFTDSSSGRQLAMRQGTGKVKTPVRESSLDTGCRQNWNHSVVTDPNGVEC